MRLLTFGLLVALAIKYAAVVALGPASIELDALGYWQLSTLVINGDWLMMGEPIAYRTPMYPWYLAAVRRIAADSSLSVIVGLQAMMLVAAFWIAARIARRITGRAVAEPLTLLVALPAISGTVYAATVLTEALFVFLLLLNLWAVLWYRDSRLTDLNGEDSSDLDVATVARRWSSWNLVHVLANVATTYGVVVLIAVSFAAALLTRPIVLYLWLPHLMFVLWNCRVSGRSLRRRTVIDVLAAAAIIVVLIAPWLARNYRMFGEPFLTEFVGRNLWIVTFQDGSGAGLDFPDSTSAAELRERIERLEADQWRATWPVSRALVASGLTDPQADRLMKQVAIEAINNDPWPFAYQTIRRTVNFWRCAVTDLPVLGAHDGDYRGQRHWSFSVPLVRWAIDHRLGQHVWFNTLVTTFIVGSVIVLSVVPSTRASGVWIGLILGYFCTVTGFLEIPNYRYRMVVEPLAATAVGAALAMLLPIKRVTESETTRLTV